MMTTTELSKYRQRLRQLINTVDKLAYQCAYTDPLIQGTSNEVYRTCGQPNCPCASDRAARHGPYRVIQVYRNKKQRQIALRQEQQDIWQKVKNYQKQKKALLLLKKTCKELTETVQEVLTKRLEELPR